MAWNLLGRQADHKVISPRWSPTFNPCISMAEITYMSQHTQIFPATNALSLVYSYNKESWVLQLNILFNCMIMLEAGK